MERNLGPYEIQKRLAVGGLAEIFLARKPGMLGFEQRYALKVLLPQYADSEEHRKLMIDEARLTAQLDHPNIIKVHDLATDDDTLFIVMEYVNGMDLSRLVDRLRRNGEQMPVPVALWIAQEICAGLHYAHTRTSVDGTHLRIVHRDVSPQNVLLGFGGEVKLIDFGVAKAVGGGRLETKTGVIKGKLTYMAPEYAVGSQQDHRSDIFAAALCLFEMLTGRPAYDGEPSDLIETIKNADVPAPRSIRDDIPAELDDVIAKATMRNPNDRYATAQEFQRTLSSLQVRVATEFNRERFAAWLSAFRRRTEDRPAAGSSQSLETAPAPATSSADDDMGDDDFAELATMAMENPLTANRDDEDELAVANTGPMEQADPRDYAASASPTEDHDHHEDEDDELADLPTLSMKPSEEMDRRLDPDEQTIDPDRPLSDDSRPVPSTSADDIPDADDELARLPTADLNVADIDPSRGEISSADQPTVTNIDVKQIRGDKRPDEPQKPRILTQSGFQKSLDEEDVERIRAESGPATIPGELPDESTSPTHQIKPLDQSADLTERSDVAPTGPETMPSGVVSTSDTARDAHTGGRGVVNPADVGGRAPSDASDRSGGRPAVDSDDVPALESDPRRPDDWNLTEPPAEKHETMGHTAEGLARKVGSKYGSFSKTEKGRRTVHTWIVALLAILFVGLLVYVFFIAE